MSEIKSYKDLIVYQKSYSLCLEIYKATKKFPPNEIYGLTSQIRRSAVSIPSNIAEGYRRKNRNVYIYFLKIAFGSCAELETQMSLARDLEYLSADSATFVLKELDAIGQLLNKLIKALEKHVG